MDRVGVLIAWNEHPALKETITSLRRISPSLPMATIIPHGGTVPAAADITILNATGLWSSAALNEGLQWFGKTGAEHLLIITGPEVPVFSGNEVKRMISCLEDTDAAIVYGDYWETKPDGSVHLSKCIDYQPGSIRDTFRFGPAMLINGRFLNTVHKSISRSDTTFSFGALYDLRLRLSESGPVIRLPEPLYRAIALATAATGSHFAYVDPRNRDYQIEMESIATAHLKRIGAWIAPPVQKPLENSGTFPVKASIIIPVRNRSRTIADAVGSALSQQCGFSFNVIVVDNHSDDGTTGVLSSIARSDSRLIHLIPDRNDLLIGGCWNKAIYSEHCGNYAVQLDSDDIYDGTGVLERIISEFDRHSCALVIGSYTTVNFDLKPLPPGLIDHREWTDTNGMNNALRIAGLGAPRAYHVPTLRRTGFPNVSYGEDYAAVLRLSRSWPVGRIYDSLYWCRRWEENSDSSLPPETANRYDHYKDRLRTIEISSRSAENRTNA